MFLHSNDAWGQVQPLCSRTLWGLCLMHVVFGFSIFCRYSHKWLLFPTIRVNNRTNTEPIFKSAKELQIFFLVCHCDWQVGESQPWRLWSSVVLLLTISFRPFSYGTLFRITVIQAQPLFLFLFLHLELRTNCTLSLVLHQLNQYCWRTTVIMNIKWGSQ